MPSNTVSYVTKQFNNREEVGLKKYGVTVDRKDLGPLAWMQHFEEELMDGLLYLVRSKQTVGVHLAAYQELTSRIKKLIDARVDQQPVSATEWEDALAAILNEVEANLIKGLMK